VAGTLGKSDTETGFSGTFTKTITTILKSNAITFVAGGAVRESALRT